MVGHTTSRKSSEGLRPHLAVGTQSPIQDDPLLHRRADLTREAFSQHWRNTMGPLRGRGSQVLAYVQNHLSSALRRLTRLDGFGEIHYRTLEDALTRS